MANLVYENFEGVGKPSGWVDNTGTPDYDYSVDPIVGAKSLMLDGTVARENNYVDFSDTGNVWTRFAVMTLNVASGYNEIFYIRNVGTRLASLKTFPDGRCQLISGSSTPIYASSIADNVPFYVWINYVKGTGANSEAHLYFSTTIKRPKSPSLSITGETLTLDANRIFLDCVRVGNSVVFDEITVSDTELSDFSFGDSNFKRFNRFKGF